MNDINRARTSWLSKPKVVSAIITAALALWLVGFNTLIPVLVLVAAALLRKKIEKRQEIATSRELFLFFTIVITDFVRWVIVIRPGSDARFDFPLLTPFADLGGGQLFIAFSYGMILAGLMKVGIYGDHSPTIPESFQRSLDQLFPDSPKKLGQDVAKRSDDVIPDTPLRGYKCGLILYCPAEHRVFFKGLRQTVNAVSEASCNLLAHVPAAHPGCTCGFYSLKDPRQLVIHGYIWHTNQRTVKEVLECDYWGQFVEGEDGCRAQWQRILAVQFAPFCTHYNKKDTCCDDPLVFTTHSHRNVPYKQTDTDAYRIQPVCLKHLDEFHTGQPSWSLPDLAALAGVEIGWQNWAPTS